MTELFSKLKFIAVYFEFLRIKSLELTSIVWEVKFAKLGENSYLIIFNKQPARVFPLRGEIVMIMNLSRILGTVWPQSFLFVSVSFIKSWRS